MAVSSQGPCSCIPSRVCVCVCVRERETETETERQRERGREGGREKVGGERRSLVVCCMGNEKSLLSLIEQALFMISKAEELKCLSSTLFFFFLRP